MSWPEVKKINSDLNTPLNEGGVKIVKSVQRGGVSYSGSDLHTIAIDEVNVSKSVVILSGNFTSYANTHALARLISPTEIEVRAFGTEVNWQVIEYY